MTKTIRRNRGALIGVVAVIAVAITSVLVTRAWVGRPGAPAGTVADANVAQAEAPRTATLPAEPTPKEGVLASTPSASTQMSEAKLPIAPVKDATASSATTQPKLQAGPTTTGTITPASGGPPEERAQRWLAGLSELLEQRDYLRAHLALERLKTRYAEEGPVKRAADELKRSAETIESKLDQGAIQQHRDYVVNSQPANTAEWQAAMTIAQGIVVERDNAGVVVVRIVLEDETAERSFRARGQGLGFYVGTDISNEIVAGNGDILFVGSRGTGSGTPAVDIRTEHHHSPTIELRPRAGRVTRLGDIVIRLRDR